MIHGSTDEEFRQIVVDLRRARLLLPACLDLDEIDAHPLVREYFARKLREDHPQAWRAGHSRLYEHLKNSSKEYPDTVKEMAPLYAAVAHGCAAERFDDALFQVYWKRIMREDEYYSLKVLGTIGTDTAALANFFEQLWDGPRRQISPKGQSLLLDQAGESLHVLGRLSEAQAALKELLRRGVATNNLKDAVKGTITLSEISLTMGRIEEAVSFGIKSVELADQKQGDFHRQVSRSTLADALHQSGQFTEAKKWFEEAEQIELQRPRKRPILSSMQGFEYCELLLTLGDFEEVQRRSEQALEFAEADHSLLAIALNHLALGRAFLCQEVLSGNGRYGTASAEINAAIDGFHRAGAEFQLPRGLLVRAELLREIGRFEDARREVDSAREIATRGQMKLHEIDCMLESARISYAAGDVSESARALDRAEEMISKVGYHRRTSAVHEIHEKLCNRQ